MGLTVEARYAGQVVATIANTIERSGVPFEPPLVLLTAGEMLVTVGQETGIGGRNQEYALAAALKIAGSEQIVIGAVDTDGTDGPGAQYVHGVEHIPTLAGGLVDGFTMREAEERGLDIRRALKQHNATPLLLGAGQRRPGHAEHRPPGFGGHIDIGARVGAGCSRPKGREADEASVRAPTETHHT